MYFSNFSLEKNIQVILRREKLKLKRKCNLENKKKDKRGISCE